MTTIENDAPLITLINVFTVDPKDQQTLIELLIGATEGLMKHLPGFVSANLHRSLDGRQVANYAQWRTAEHFKAMLENPDARSHMTEIRRLATNEANLYTVIHVESKDADPVGGDQARTFAR